MAGVSLNRGDSGLLLKSVEEAQEHAELTSHSSLSESTEAVLNLVCTSGGKPCRSKTECDLHTKPTGHTMYTDEPELDLIPMALVNTNAGPPNPPLPEEEKRLELEELREQARKKKEEEDEIIEAKRIEWENEIKRALEIRKAEEEERRAIEENIQHLPLMGEKKPSFHDSSLADGYSHLHHEASFKVQDGKDTKPHVAPGTNGRIDQKSRDINSKGRCCIL